MDGWHVPKGVRGWLSRQLRRWFRRHARDLPWRRTRDPYAIWVSEVMLQQTQAATAAPYFERFLRTFPDIASLARADLQEVLQHWQGLGYYRRARDLHRAARLLHKEHGGRLPPDPEALVQLPGFGRYTTGAVLSQAYDRPLAILEANSRRVLSRLLSRPPARSATRHGPTERGLWEAAEALLPRRGVGEYNQALMELGALVCKPRHPRCDDCPLMSRCNARQYGTIETAPTRRGPAQDVREVAVVVRRAGRVLLVQRPREGRWAGLWEFPHAEMRQDETPTAAARRILRALAGIDADPDDHLLTLRHSVTRFRITLACFAARYRKGAFRSDFYLQSRWLPPQRVFDYPLSSPQRRLALALTRQ